MEAAVSRRNQSRTSKDRQCTIRGEEAHRKSDVVRQYSWAVKLSTQMYFVDITAASLSNLTVARAVASVIPQSTSLSDEDTVG